MELPAPLSASVKGSFAYFTVKERLPVILTKVIDSLSQKKEYVRANFGKDGLEESKLVIGRLSKLRNEMETNKPFIRINPQNFNLNKHDDTSFWNKSLCQYAKSHGEFPLWFESPWLLAECYMYRRIYEAFYLSSPLAALDPFLFLKENATLESKSDIEGVANLTLSHIQNIKSYSSLDLELMFSHFIQICVWGNKCDLSISSGDVDLNTKNLLLALDSMKSYLLVNDTYRIWNYLRSLQPNTRNIAFILDNVGLELISDLCLLTLLTEANIIDSVHIYAKAFPWFVSDTTSIDLKQIIEGKSCRNVLGKTLADLVSLWTSYVTNRKWIIKEEWFWTTACVFSEMKSQNFDLYSNLEKFSLLVFKGDLNYRKLVGDLDWPTNTDFKNSLENFLPTSVAVLRTIKGGPVVGVLDETVDKVSKENKDWNISGKYGVIQFILSE